MEIMGGPHTVPTVDFGCQAQKITPRQNKNTKKRIFLMAICCLALGITVVIGITVTGLQDYGEDYNYDDYNGNSSEINEETPVNKPIKMPVFISTSTTVVVSEGNTIKLPCLFEELDNGLVLMWKQGSEIIALGNKPYETDDKRIKVKKLRNGNQLVIMLAQEKDAGKYTCQVSTTEAGGITHEVKIRVKPGVVSVPSSGLIAVQAGEPAELGCEVTRGSPEPELTWKRRERRMSSGEETLVGKKKIKFLSTTRHHSGIYICLAHNGWGTPAIAEIRLDVQHPPEIENEQMLVENSDGGNDLELTCTVHASPVAKVAWEKDGEQMINKDNVITVRGNKHSLLLHEVHKMDRSGTYTCKAENSLGVAEVVTDISEDGNVKKVHSVPHQHQPVLDNKPKENNVEPNNQVPKSTTINETEQNIELDLKQRNIPKEEKTEDMQVKNGNGGNNIKSINNMDKLETNNEPGDTLLYLVF